MKTDWDVIVVGAGLAGLSAAATAQQGGARVLVLEAHGPGGRARTVERDGFTLNMGAHALYRGGPGFSVLRSLGVTPEGLAPPLGRYEALTSGCRHLLPTGAGTLVRTDVLSARSKAQLIRFLGLLPLTRTARLGTVSVADWLAGHDLRADAEAVIRALIRLGTYAADVDEFSADAAAAQLQVAARGGVLYLHGGWGKLVTVLSRSLDIRTGVQVTGVDRHGDHVEVRSQNGSLVAHRVVLAAGGPAAVRRLLPAEPGWQELGPPVTAACLDQGVRRIPEPGYVLSLDEPLYVTVQSPPARQAPTGQAVVAVIRYGARSAAEDRPQLEDHASHAGVRPGDVVVSRFLAHISVAGALPRAATGGLAGRPKVEDSGVPGVAIAGDWVGPVGLLPDASLASGRASGHLVGQDRPNSSKMVT